MADRPIIFYAPMVRALLEGRKTQTRRVLNAKSGVTYARSVLQRGAHWLGIEYDRSWPLRLQYAPGDRLWVREAFRGDAGYDRTPPREWSQWPLHYEVDCGGCYGTCLNPSNCLMDDAEAIRALKRQSKGASHE